MLIYVSGDLVFEVRVTSINSRIETATLISLASLKPVRPALLAN